MKLLYCALMCRFNLLRPVCALAALVTKWTPECDERLMRLTQYVKTTSGKELIGYIGDEAKSLTPNLFADADLGGAAKLQEARLALIYAYWVITLSSRSLRRAGNKAACLPRRPKPK